MISTAYDQQCETLPFAWRNIRFVLAGFWLHRGGKRNETGAVIERTALRSWAASSALGKPEVQDANQAFTSQAVGELRPEKSRAKGQLSDANH